jgi:IclR family transcriptional regulator, KDG regulon repressor
MSEVIRKSVALLNTIIPNEEKEEWGTTELSRELDIPIQTVHRLLSSLSDYGFVTKNVETKKFRLGLAIMNLGLSIRDNLLVRNHSLVSMDKLAKKTKESVYLTVPEASEGVFIDCIDYDVTLKIAEPIGMRTPLCNGASKKVILAHMKKKTREHIIQQLFDQGKILDLNGFNKELKEISECGYAFSVGETTKGTMSIAAPIFSGEDNVIASISVGGSEMRFRKQNLNLFINETKKAAEEISKQLGCINRF